MSEESDNPDKLVIGIKRFWDDTYEAGGFILEKDSRYVFIQVPNIHHNTSTGRALYEPDGSVFAKLLGPYFMGGWVQWASMHTHPTFTSQYSMIDYLNLFANYRFNYIKSVLYGDIVKYTWIDETRLKGERIYES